MIPMRHSTIFKSRWMALIWSAGILWLAVDVAGGSPSQDAGSNMSDNGSDARGEAAVAQTRGLVDDLNRQ